MHVVRLYAEVRRYVMVAHHSQREAAIAFGISRDMVAKMLRHTEPPGYRRINPLHRPSLGPYVGWIDATLESDLHQPRKQRHTAKRIFQRLRDEHGYQGGYTTVKTTSAITASAIERCSCRLSMNPATPRSILAKHRSRLPMTGVGLSFGSI